MLLSLFHGDGAAHHFSFPLVRAHLVGGGIAVSVEARADRSGMGLAGVPSVVDAALRCLTIVDVSPIALPVAHILAKVSLLLVHLAVSQRHLPRLR